MAEIRRCYVSIETWLSINWIFSEGNNIFFSCPQQSSYCRKMSKRYWTFYLWQVIDTYPRSTAMSSRYWLKVLAIASSFSLYPDNLPIASLLLFTSWQGLQKAWHCIKGHVPQHVLTELKGGIAGRERQEAAGQGRLRGQQRIFSLWSSTRPLVSAASWERMSPTPKEPAVYSPGGVKVEFTPGTGTES